MSDSQFKNMSDSQLQNIINLIQNLKLGINNSDIPTPDQKKQIKNRILQILNNL